MEALTLRVVQIGDLHHPAVGTAQGFVDYKDKAFSPALATHITPDPLMDSLRALIADIEQTECNAVVAMGDIINQGSKKDYMPGVHVLLDGFLRDDTMRAKTVVLPGNHDINRDDALAENGLYEKFRHITDAARAFGLQPVEVDHVGAMPLANGTARGTLFAMNSCLGCGASRAMPDKIRKEVEELISEEIQEFWGYDAEHLL